MSINKFRTKVKIFYIFTNRVSYSRMNYRIVPIGIVKNELCM